MKLPILDNPATFRKYISKNGMHRVSRRNDWENLRKLLSTICLRRTKSLLKCFAYKEEKRQPDFTPEEFRQYKTLEAAVNGAVKAAIGTHSNKITHHRVMEALLRLRMFCNNGVTIRNTWHLADEVLSLLQQNGTAICGFCFCDILMVHDSSSSGLVYLTMCSRIVCAECVTQYEDGNRLSSEMSEWSCPLCHKRHGSQYLTLGRDPNGPESGGSSHRSTPSKIKAVLEDVQAHYLQEKW